jgi:hypothetical protein
LILEGFETYMIFPSEFECVGLRQEVLTIGPAPKLEVAAIGYFGRMHVPAMWGHFEASNVQRPLSMYKYFHPWDGSTNPDRDDQDSALLAFTINITPIRTRLLELAKFIYLEDPPR